MVENNKKQKFFLCAGGTGGHIFPAECIAEELVSRGHDVSLITDERYKNYLNNEKKFPIIKIKSGNLSRGIINIFIGILQSMWLFYKYPNPVVIGFGGYPSFPALFAAWFIGRKTIIHEQNAIFGRANKLLARLVDLVAVGFKTKKYSELKNVIFTGSPVRHEINKINNYPVFPNGSEGVLRIMVLGGSLGANIFSDVIPKALELLTDNERSKIMITQQVRNEDFENVLNKYSELKVKSELMDFISDVPKRLAVTQLLICRSGASTTAEIMAAKRPAIMVPYPNATDDHQYYNAKILADSGATWLIRQKGFSPEYLAERLREFLNNPELLVKAHSCFNHFPKIDSVKTIADIAEKYAIGGDIDKLLKEYK